MSANLHLSNLDMGLPRDALLVVEEIRNAAIGWGNNSSVQRDGNQISAPERSLANEQRDFTTNQTDTQTPPGLSAGDVILRAEMAAVVTARDAGYEGTRADEALLYNQAIDEAELGNLALPQANEAVERINAMVQGV